MADSAAPQPTPSGPPAQTPPPPPEPLAIPATGPLPSFGDRFGRMLERYRSKLPTFIALSAYTAVVPSFAAVALVVWTVPLLAALHPLASTLLTLVLVAVPTYLAAIGIAGIAVTAAYKTGLKNAFVSGFARSFAFVRAVFIIGLAATLPYALFVIPGIWLSVRYALVMPVLATEKLRGFASVRRSWELTRGHMLMVFANVFLVHAAITVISGIASPVASGLGASFGAMIGVEAIGTYLIPGLVSLAVISIALPFPLIMAQLCYEDLTKRAKPEPAGAAGTVVTAVLAGLSLLVFVSATYSLNTLLPDVLRPGESGGEPVEEAPTIDEVPTAAVLCGEDELRSMDDDGTVRCTPKDADLTPQERDWLRYGDIHKMRLALASHQNIVGWFPKSLDELVPKFLETVPVDPVTQLPYRYYLEDGNYKMEFAFEAGMLAYAAGQHYLTPGGFDVGNVGAAIEDTKQDTGLTVVPVDPNAPVEIVKEPENPFPTKPDAFDTDNDGLSDADEARLGTNLDAPDTDGDGLNDYEEAVIYRSSPRIADTDGDGTLDGHEVAAGLDPTNDGVLSDFDQDGLADVYETDKGYDGGDADMDDDGIADGDEVRVYGTDPHLADTDGDGFSDLDEIRGGYDPNGLGSLQGALGLTIAENATVYGLHEPTLTNLSR